MATDIIARGMITEYKSGTNISFKENDDGSVTISASGDVSSEDTVARDTIDNHKLDKNNPHNVTAEQIGLGNVDNTSDLDKPISTAIQTALDDKADKTTATKDSDGLMSAADKAKLDGIEENANHTVIDSELSDTSENAIQNRAVAKAVKGGNSLSGSSSYTITDSVEYPLVGLKVYGKSTQDGTPTPETPVDIISVGDSGSVTITVDNGDSISATATIMSALPLCGIPVSSGGNYTDSNGQQWLCDELICNADGTGKIIKNSEIVVFDGSDDEKWINPHTITEFTNDFRIQYSKLNGTKAENISSSFTILYCNRLQHNNTIWNNDIAGCQLASIGDFIVRMPSSIIGGNDVVAFKSWLADNPLTVVYQIVPQEIELTAMEVNALRTLQTFDGITNIFNNGGADMNVKYCTNKALSEFVRPVTMGLQKQIDELKAAVLSLGGNV